MIRPKGWKMEPYFKALEPQAGRARITIECVSGPSRAPIAQGVLGIEFMEGEKFENIKEIARLLNRYVSSVTYVEPESALENEGLEPARRMDAANSD